MNENDVDKEKRKRRNQFIHATVVSIVLAITMLIVMVKGM